MEEVVRSLVTAYVDIIATQVAEEHKLVIPSVIVTPLQGIVRTYKGLVDLRFGLIVILHHISGSRTDIQELVATGSQYGNGCQHHYFAISLHIAPYN